MTTVQVMMEVPKESKEVVDVLASIITDIKLKKSAAEIGAGNLTKLFAAVEGFDQLDDEFKSDGQDEVTAYLVKEIMVALKAAPAVPAAPVA